MIYSGYRKDGSWVGNFTDEGIANFPDPEVKFTTIEAPRNNGAMYYHRFDESISEWVYNIVDHKKQVTIETNILLKDHIERLSIDNGYYAYFDVIDILLNPNASDAQIAKANNFKDTVGLLWKKFSTVTDAIESSSEVEKANVYLENILESQ
jgi:hypothetical protein